MGLEKGTARSLQSWKSDNKFHAHSERKRVMPSFTYKPTTQTQTFLRKEHNHIYVVIRYCSFITHRQLLLFFFICPIIHPFIDSFLFHFFFFLQGLQVTIYDIHELLDFQLSSSVLYPIFTKDTRPATKGNSFLNCILQFM